MTSARSDCRPVVGSLIYSLLRVLLDALATKHGDQAELQAEVLALRRQAQVLERQIKRAHWSPGDRMVLAAQLSTAHLACSHSAPLRFTRKWLKAPCARSSITP